MTIPARVERLVVIHGRADATLSVALRTAGLVPVIEAVENTTVWVPAGGDPSANRAVIAPTPPRPKLLTIGQAATAVGSAAPRSMRPSATVTLRSSTWGERPGSRPRRRRIWWPDCAANTTSAGPSDGPHRPAAGRRLARAPTQAPSIATAISPLRSSEAGRPPPVRPRRSIGEPVTTKVPPGVGRELESSGLSRPAPRAATSGAAISSVRRSPPTLTAQLVTRRGRPDRGDLDRTSQKRKEADVIKIRTTNMGRRYDVRLRDPDGRVYTRTFATRREAERFEAQEHTDRSRGAWVDPHRGTITLEQWSTQWLVQRQATFARNEMARSSSSLVWRFRQAM
jgi:hypothetical protein